MNDSKKYFNNWEIDCELGSGAFGTVYRIKKEEFGKVYYSAMKIIKIPQDSSDLNRLKSEGMDDKSISDYYHQFAQDFFKEIDLMSSLRGNTNIVDYDDHIIEENENGIGFTIYIKMEYLKPLEEYLISKTGTRYLPLKDVIRLGVDICSALEECAVKKVIHRDIKIENIFISDNNHFKLGDFGIARKLEATQSNLSKKGTYTYMAPEIYNGKPYNNTVDIYSLGIVMYRLLNQNRAPFLPLPPSNILYSDREKSIVLRMSGEAIPSIEGISFELNRIVLKACAFNPKDRYQSAKEMKRDLLAIASEDTLEVAFDEKLRENGVKEIDEIDDDTVSGFERLVEKEDLDIEKIEENDKKTISGIADVNNKKKKSKFVRVVVVLVAIVVIFAVFGILTQNNKQSDMDSVLNDVNIPEIDEDILNFESPFSNMLDDLGTITDTYYKNEKYGLVLHLPSSDWTFMSNEEIEQYHSGVSFDESISKYYYQEEKGKTYYDMVMYNTKTNEVAEVIIVKADAGVEFTLGEYFAALEDAYKEKFSGFKFSNAGITTFGDSMYSVKEFYGNLNGVDLYQYIAGNKPDESTIVMVSLVAKDESKSFLQYFDEMTE